jgi:hypothetical protein
MIRFKTKTYEGPPRYTIALSRAELQHLQSGQPLQISLRDLGVSGAIHLLVAPEPFQWLAEDAEVETPVSAPAPGVEQTS